MLIKINDSEKIPYKYVQGVCVQLSIGKELEWVEFIAFIRIIATHIHKKEYICQKCWGKMPLTG